MITCSKKQKKSIAKHVSQALRSEFSWRGGKKKLAALAGVTPSALSQWKNGSKTPTLQHLILLSQAIGVPIHTLCGVSDARTIRGGDPVLKRVIALSVIGSMLEDPGRMTPSARRKLDRIGKVLKKAENSMN